ncbi:MAG TPA: hypothetical protein VM469_03915 [Pseudoxanthomonas sp.]|nr:hypothetical protein [Pseudoxanthomonas sp.]
MRRMTLLCLSLFSVSTLLAAEPTQDPAALRVKLMEETKLIAQMGIEGPSADFKDDGDPKTLQVVFLDKRSDGPSRVSPDGEVVFLYKASDELQSELIGKAFDVRVTRALAGD